MCQVCILYERFDTWSQILRKTPSNIKYKIKASRKVLCVDFTKIIV